MFNKYGNIRRNGFDSRREERRYQELLLMQRAGKIFELQRQVKFQLSPTQREPDVTGPKGGVKRGKVIEHPCNYIADFVYLQNGKMVVEDCKGFRTPEYIVKRKWMLEKYGIRILET